MFIHCDVNVAITAESNETMTTVNRGLFISPNALVGGGAVRGAGGGRGGPGGRVSRARIQFFQVLQIVISKPEFIRVFVSNIDKFLGRIFEQEIAATVFGRDKQLKTTGVGLTSAVVR